MNKEELLELLYSKSDDQYKKFTKKITPGEFNMIGVRIPELKKIIKDADTQTINMLLSQDDSNIFELRMLKGLAISSIKDLETYKQYFDNFVPLINNWSICDTFIANSKIIKKDLNYFWNKILVLLSSEGEFTNRVGFVLILNYFLVDEYIDLIYLLIDGYRSDKYYANMALAWLISFLYIKYPIKTKSFLKSCDLNSKVIQMSLRKIKDSYRVSIEDKEWIKNKIKLF